MNDFTKAELIKINEVLERDSWELFTDLQSKIQSMIDNYCEHENAGQDYSCNRCWDCGECW